jgi:hypothetical protein
MKTFTHKQTSPSISWVIDHNLGHTPNIDVIIDFNGQRTKILPRDIVHDSINRMTVVFSLPQSGTAVLV